MFNVSPTLNLPAPRYTVHMLQHGGKKTTVWSLAGEHLGAVTLAAAYIYSTQSCWPWSCWSLLLYYQFVVMCNTWPSRSLLCGQHLQALLALKKQQRRLEWKWRGRLSGRIKALQHFHLILKRFNFNAHNHSTKTSLGSSPFLKPDTTLRAFTIQWWQLEFRMMSQNFKSSNNKSPKDWAKCGRNSSTHT